MGTRLRGGKEVQLKDGDTNAPRDGDWDRARQGDADAIGRLMDGVYEPLVRWTHGRLPRSARDVRDTRDLVHECLARTLQRFPALEFHRQEEFMAFLRVAVMNQIKNEFRSKSRRPPREEMGDEIAGRSPSPFTLLVAERLLEHYQQALLRLRDEDREAIRLHVELGYDHEEVARELGKPSADAARMAVSRAIRALAEAMDYRSPRRRPRRDAGGGATE